MQPLYKRYIPPKASALTPRDSIPDTSPTNTVTVDRTTVNSKRLRSEADIPDRNAKKVKTREGSGANIVVNHDSGHDRAITQSSSAKSGTQGSTDTTSNFSHIKNVKKRHKLEKEARKARKTAQGATALVENTDNSEATGFLRSKTNILAGQGTAQADYVRNNGVAHATQMNPNPGSAQTRRETDSEARPDGEFSIMAGKLDSGVGRTFTEKKGAINVNGNRADEAPLSSEKRSKKRQHKLEAALQEAKSNLSNEDEPSVQKHVAILEKFQKSTSTTRNGLLLQQQEQQVVEHSKEETFQAPIVRDLVIPEPQPPASGVMTSTLLLPWLAKPLIVHSKDSIPFESLNLDRSMLEKLTKLGFEQALAVQKALIPLLLKSSNTTFSHQALIGRAVPDVAVHAPTGSGKTIAYIVPIIESLRHRPADAKLRALVLVPTRELVSQVASVCENLCKGTSIKVGTATGSGRFGEESSKLVSRKRRFGPERYRELVENDHRHNYDSITLVSALPNGTADASNGANFIQDANDAANILADHIIVYESAVDILVATPGRLHEHLKKSRGFSLTGLEWLVLDEADKLLDQEYDGLLQTIETSLSAPRPLGEQGYREQYLRARGSWEESRERHTRKILLSATMTRDISKLSTLKLQRPQMIVVRGNETTDDDGANEGLIEEENANAGESFELPTGLTEHSVHAGDGSLKPLFFAEIIRRLLTPSGTLNGAYEEPRESETDSESDSCTSTDSDSDSASGSSNQSSSTEGRSTPDSEDLSMNSDNTGVDFKPNDSTRATSLVQMSVHPDRQVLLARTEAAVPTILTFTSSTESANRLSYLLMKLHPEWAPYIAALTRASPKSKLHSQAKATDPIITISTDRAARGLDVIAHRRITHVIQYDVPRSLTSYVHRVGRTARADYAGQAWTIFTHNEARWFTKTIVKSAKIIRASEMQKIKLAVGSEDWKRKLEEAVASIRERALIFSQ